MVAINDSFISYALQALGSVVKSPIINALSAVLTIDSIKSGSVDLFLKKASAVINNSTDQQTGQLSLMALIKQIINETSLAVEDTKATNKTVSTLPLKPNIRLTEEKSADNIANAQLIKPNFSLAEKIDKLYPRTTPRALDDFDRFVVFGDSLSDSTGRMFEKTHHIFPSYNQYHDGRFTNGFVWSEFLSSPAFLNKEIVNFAEAGSTSASYSRLNPFSYLLSNLETQMKNYKSSNRDFTLFFAGANDYITLHKDDVLHVVEKQVDDIDKLLSGKVKHVLVMGMPDISLTPDAQFSDEQRKYKDITIAHNTLLKKNIEELKIKYSDKKIFFFDTASAFNQITKVAREIGYDTEHAYTTHGYIHVPTEHEPALNIGPQNIYNDGVHPTQEVHHAFATLLADFISQNYSRTAAAAA